MIFAAPDQDRPLRFFLRQPDSDGVYKEKPAFVPGINGFFQDFPLRDIRGTDMQHFFYFVEKLSFCVRDRKLQLRNLYHKEPPFEKYSSFEGSITD